MKTAFGSISKASVDMKTAFGSISKGSADKIK